MEAKEKLFTPKMLRTFDALTERTSSRDQVTRIEARFDLEKFVKEHGTEACAAMQAELKRRGKW